MQPRQQKAHKAAKAAPPQTFEEKMAAARKTTEAPRKRRKATKAPRKIKSECEATKAARPPTFEEKMEAARQATAAARKKKLERKAAKAALIQTILSSGDTNVIVEEIMLSKSSESSVRCKTDSSEESEIGTQFKLELPLNHPIVKSMNLKPNVVPLPIGKGSTANVYKVTNDDGESWAIKHCRSYRELAKSIELNYPEFAEVQQKSFIQERNVLEALKVLKCPHLVDYAGYFEGTTPQNHHLVFKFYPRDLYSFCRGGVPTPEEQKLIMIDLLKGLSVLHGASILHRDVKPENILIDFEKEIIRPVLADFGSAILIEDCKEFTTDVSTIKYCPPEYFAKEKPPRNTPTADLYALGMSLYTSFFQKRLTGESTTIGYIDHLAEGGYPKLDLPDEEHLSLEPNTIEIIKMIKKMTSSVETRVSVFEALIELQDIKPLSQNVEPALQDFKPTPMAIHPDVMPFSKIDVTPQSKKTNSTTCIPIPLPLCITGTPPKKQTKINNDKPIKIHSLPQFTSKPEKISAIDSSNDKKPHKQHSLPNLHKEKNKSELSQSYGDSPKNPTKRDSFRMFKPSSKPKEEVPAIVVPTKTT